MSERGHEHDPWREELSAYLLGVLDPAEAAELEGHLAGCEQCRAELTWLRPAARVLPESVERVEAPGELRARIMAEVRGEAQGSRAEPSGTGWLGSLRRRLARRSLTPLRTAAGFAAVVLIAVGIAAYAVRDGADPAGEATTVLAGEAPGVTAKMVREGDSGTLHLAHLHSLPPDEVLQAWVRRGRRVESARALLVPNQEGTASAVIDDMGDVDAVMVTVEPRGGSDHPTSSPLISLRVAQ